MQATVQEDAVDTVRLALDHGGLPAEALGVLEARLDRVRRLGGRFALVGVSPEVTGMLKMVGRAKLVC